MALPDLIILPFADSGDKQTPPQTDALGFVNFTQGYTTDYEINLASGNPAGKAVERQIQNYLFNQMTLIGQTWQQQSVAPWYSTMPGGYAKGAMVAVTQGDGSILVYRSRVAANSAAPSASGTTANWEYIPYTSELLTVVPMPGGGATSVPPGGQINEIVTVAKDFNTFTTGTYEFASDAIANGSANAPVQPGTSGTFAGMLETKLWTSGPNSFGEQRYCDRTGNMFVRGFQNGTWTAWRSITPVSNYGVDSGVVNAYNVAVPGVAIANNTKVSFKPLVTNTGASTLVVNGSAAAPIVGMYGAALIGGELPANSIVEVRWNSSIGTGSWVLLNNDLGIKQVGAGSYGVTPAQFDSSIKLATTGFVQRALGNAQAATIIPDGATYNISAAQAGSSLWLAGSTTFVAKLPLLSSVPAGATFTFFSSNAGAPTVVTSGSDLMYFSGTAANYLTSIALGTGDTLTLQAYPGQGWAVVDGSVGLVYSNSYTRFLQNRCITYRTVSSTNFIVPAGITTIFVSGCGGGGGGGGGGGAIANANITGTTFGFGGGGGGGGGAGATVWKYPLSVTPGETLVVNVGGGGTAGSAGTPTVDPGSGFAGANSTVTRGGTAIWTAGGGGPGQAAAGGSYKSDTRAGISGGPGGLGGSGSSPLPGARGQSGTQSAFGAGNGGSGGSSGLGGGGGGGCGAGFASSGGPGAAGDVGGGGGGGGAGQATASSAANGFAGGAGGQGLVFIEW